MTDAVIGSLDCVDEIGFMVNSIYDPGDVDEFLEPSSVILAGCNDDSEVGAAGLLSPSSAKSRSGQRNKGRPMKPLGSANTGSCRSVIQCTICNKTFNNSSALAKHKLIHSDERKYACTLCSKAFKRQDHLNGHTMTHYSKKPYECKFIGCDKSYCDARSLRRHLENHHQQMIAAESGSSAANSDSGTLTPASAPPEGTAAGMSVFKFDAPYLLTMQNGNGSESGNDVLLSAGMWPAGYDPFNEPKPVKCTKCDRRFRNLPALNGHMRLHGGYTKKDIIDIKPEDLNVNSDQIVLSTTTASVRPEKLLTPKTAVTSPLSNTNAGGSTMFKTTFKKTDSDIADCMLDQTASIFNIPSIDGCSNGTDPQLSTGGNRTSLFNHNWLDGKQSSDTSETDCVDVKLESVECVGQILAADCCNDLDFSMFTSDEFFTTDILGSSNLDDVVNSVQSLSSLTGLGGDRMAHQQHMLLDDDVNAQFGFGQATGHTLKDECTGRGFDNNTLKSPPATVSNEPVVFGARTHSFPDQNTSVSVAYVTGISSNCQLTFTKTIADSFSLQQSQHTPVETRGVLPRYGSCFQFTNKSEQEPAFHCQPTTSKDSDVMFASSYAVPDNRDSFAAVEHPSTPQTPMFSSIGAKMQQMNLRTPRTPYSPSTPNRANRFQFPASSVAADVQPHGYQKTASYHPYVPSIQQQPPSSPHYLNQRHMAAMHAQHERHRFRHNMAQPPQQELDQLLHQMHQKDIISQQQQHTVHGITVTPQSDQQAVYNMDGFKFTESKQSIPANDVFDILFSDQPGTSFANQTGTSLHGNNSVAPVSDRCQAFVPEKVMSTSDQTSSDFADMLDQKKNKRKHKPEPLVIPADVSNFGRGAPATVGGAVQQWDSSCHQDFGVSPYLESSVVVTNSMAGGSWALRNTSCGMQPQSAPLYWTPQSYDIFDGRGLETRIPP